MTRLKDILTPSFRDSGSMSPCPWLVVVAYDSDFCQDVVAKGWLTEEQMHHAADSYRLGKSRSGKCIFWMIDELGRIRDGRLGNSWVSQLLKAREPEILREYHARHCLFGLHLLCHTDITDSTGFNNDSSDSCHLCSEDKPICVVDSEQSAVVLSELLPESLWMAYSCAANMTPDLFESLQGRTVTIYPRTDPSASTYLSFLEFAEEVRCLYDIDITIDDVLEEHATPEQKERQIDLLDFLLEENKQ